MGDADKTMGEIVSQIRRVATLIGQIAGAANERSAGIGQVNIAVTQLEQMTQQNAALVEQSAAAAESLKDQARNLTQAVSAFKPAAGSEAACLRARLFNGVRVAEPGTCRRKSCWQVYRALRK